MRIRFRTHLTVATSLLTALAIAVTSGLLLTLSVFATAMHYNRRGILLTKLATRNIEYGMTLPNRVMERVGEQMVVSALLSAELVAVAEEKAQLSPEEVSALLRRVVERSSELGGYRLVDEFWLTDDEGRAYIHTEDFEFTFPELGGGRGQAGVFRALLEPGTPPVVQQLQPREADAKPFKYVGVGGVDKPRIVQVGVGEELVESIRSDFLVQNMLEQFITQEQPGAKESPHGPGPPGIDTYVTRIAMVHPSGEIIAEAGEPSAPGLPITDHRVVRFCQAFLENPKAGVAVEDFNGQVGVVTLFQPPRAAEPYALFMQHRTEAFLQVAGRQITFVGIVGIVLVLLAVLVSVKMGQRFSRPITELSAAAEHFGEGNLDYRIELRADRELQSLAGSFNAMADSIQSYTRQLRDETKRRERLESEMRIAAEMQQALLPVCAPDVQGLEICGWSVAAREVGGDFYDYIDFGDGRFGAVIGDGTDKGLPAAMLVTECWSVLRALAGEKLDPAELLHCTNNAMHLRIGESGRFVTLFFLVIDVPHRRLRYAVAGHNPPLLIGRGSAEVRQLRSKSGLPLGIQRDCVFETTEIPLDEGDTILLYSDGITEAPDRENELYGMERFCHCVTDSLGRPLPELLAQVRGDVATHTGRDVPLDDMTLVGLRLVTTGRP